jgi:tetratricopeptide (TPR) repeat protein
LGESLIAANAGRDAEGRAILLGELARRPNSPVATHAWFSVAIASNRMRQFDQELNAYDRALEREYDPDQRARIYMNRGEAKMSIGDLAAARDDYQLALSSSSDSEVFALANWGLGVALARDNELAQALEHVRTAAGIKFRIEDEEVLAIDLPSVFYTPPYEIFYYRALLAMAEAEKGAQPEDAIASLDRATLLFRQYLTDGRAASDRWVQNVERYLVWCERRRTRIARAAQAAGHKLRPPKKAPVEKDTEPQ